MKPLHRRDLLLIASILIIAVILWMGNLLLQKPAVSVRVTVDGTVVREFDLDKDQEYDIFGHGQGMNHLVIRNGAAWIDGASCPDQVCVKQGRIRQDGQVIVCMPNRVMIQIQ